MFCVLIQLKKGRERERTGKRNWRQQVYRVSRSFSVIAENGAQMEVKGRSSVLFIHCDPSCLFIFMKKNYVH